jgi:hypothetical protein
MDYLRNLSPVLALVTLTAIVSGLTGWRKGIGYKEIVKKEKSIENAAGARDPVAVKYEDSLNNSEINIVRNSNLSLNLENSVPSIDNNTTKTNEVMIELKYEGLEEEVILDANKKVKLVISDPEYIKLEGFIPETFLLSDFTTQKMLSVIRDNTGFTVTEVEEMMNGGISYKLSDKLVNLPVSKQNNIKNAFIAVLDGLVHKDFENRWFKKGRASIAAGISAVAGTAVTFIWKDKFGELGSWIFGGCDKYVCNSTFFYGENSSESAIGMKADAVYQQIPFNERKVNYVMNVVQGFSQTCLEMMKQTAESQTLVLYAGDSDINVGKHYLISDVNNKLCPIGDMDMNEFIEPVGIDAK